MSATSRPPGADRQGAASGPILALDTATSVAVVALGDDAGRLVAEASWPAGYRHGEELLARVDALLDGAAIRLADLRAIVVGTGPGAFTGLRVGLATAKGLAHGLGVPLLGVPTATALAAAADAGPGARNRATGAGTIGGGPLVVLLPAGPSDRVVSQAGQSRLVPGGAEPELPADAVVVAVDLDGRAEPSASARGRLARAGLGAALVRLGAARLAAGERDDLAGLVPEYVTLPRGIVSESGEVEWSRDPQ